MPAPPVPGLVWALHAGTGTMVDGTTASTRPVGVLERLGETDLRRRMAWEPEDAPDWAPLVDREWLVTNGLGGYAAGTVAGAHTRRYHGLLIAAHPAPLGRLLMLADLAETLRLPDGGEVRLGGEERPSDLQLHGARHLEEFRLDWGFPVWTYRIGEHRVQKRLVMVHGRNTISVEYAVLDGAALELEIRPAVNFRSHDAPVDQALRSDYDVTPCDRGLDVHCGDAPTLRLRHDPDLLRFTHDPAVLPSILYRVEASRGYAAVGDTWSPGRFHGRLEPGRPLTVVASTAADADIPAPDHTPILARELGRRLDLVERAGARTDPLLAELALAADAYVIEPASRAGDADRARDAGREAKSVIAGYHWFTDWGRDTMISLDGLTLATGRHREAADILRTFAGHVRDGLIPNLFPEGDDEGLYHTADATLWFFHAVHRYVEVTGDRALLRELLPTLRDIVDHHVRGTRFGIGVDPADDLLRQGEPGYQLTWMDAKVDGWVVTPRRGKAVEINALWYNALRLLEGWLREAGDGAGDGAAGDAAAADAIARRAARTRASFNRRFWYEEGGYLYDVVDRDDNGDGDVADDPAFRPNQLFAIALDHPVLDEARWRDVLERVEERLLTPVGLRSLAPGHPDYHPRYSGDLRTRDAAYHQGTVWGWLMGPFVDAWLRVHPDRVEEGRAFLDGLIDHLDEACLGQLSEVFDAEEPHTPRGCVAQAWTVAELLRCLRRTTGHGSG